jgi:hypothetical protein
MDDARPGVAFSNSLAFSFSSVLIAFRCEPSHVAQMAKASTGGAKWRSFMDG